MQQLLKEGIVLMQEKDYVSAMECWKRVLKLLNSGTDELTSLVCLENIAICCQALNDEKEATIYYKEMAQICGKLYGQRNLMMYRSIGKLADCLSRLEQYADELPLRQQLLELLKESFGEINCPVAVCSVNLGVCLCELEHHSEALSCFQKSLEIVQRLQLKEREITIFKNSLKRSIEECKNSIASGLDRKRAPAQTKPNESTVEPKLRDSQVLETFLEISIFIKQIAEQGDVKKANLLTEAVIRFDSCNNFMERMQCCKEAYQAIEELYGADDECSIYWKMQIVMCLTDLEYYGDAIEFWEQTQTLTGAELTAKFNYTRLLFYNCAAKSLKQLSFYKESLTLWEKAKDLAKARYGTDHRRTFNAIFNAAGCLTQLKHYKEAKVCWKEARDISSKVYGPQSELSIRCDVHVGFCLIELKFCEDAMEHLTKVLESCIEHLGKEHETTIQCLGLGQTALRMLKGNGHHPQGFGWMN